jgi:hypothetical protein
MPHLLASLRSGAAGCGHPRLSSEKQGVDGRDKPGHDELSIQCKWKML